MSTKNFKIRVRVPGKYIPTIIKQKYYKMTDGKIKQADIAITDKLLVQPRKPYYPDRKDYYFNLELSRMIAFVNHPQKLRIRPITDSDILTGTHDYYIILDAHFLDTYVRRDYYNHLLEVAETTIDPVHGQVIECQVCFIIGVLMDSYIGMSHFFIKPKQGN